MIDDRTAAYIIEAHKHFEDLLQVASQLAGLMVLAAAGGESAVPDHPMLEAARRLHLQASDGLLATRVTKRAGMHHLYLVEAAAALGESLTKAEVSLCAVDPVLTPLRVAFAHLERASQALPGFEMVSFEHACCARTT